MLSENRGILFCTVGEVLVVIVGRTSVFVFIYIDMKKTWREQKSSKTYRLMCCLNFFAFVNFDIIFSCDGNTRIRIKHKGIT
jgi:hypothetical protein